jgi:SAM-dependent methyltransferase
LLLMSVSPLHGDEPASAWVRRWSHLAPAGGSVLDVACGRGRHARWFAALGHRVTALDRSAEALAAIGLPAERCETVLADIEGGPWPLPGRQFDALVVTNYLWRSLMETLLVSIAPGGVLIYETFAAGNETVGKPSRPDFLLQPGELLQLCQSLRTVAYEDGFETGLAGSTGRFVQRIAAVRELPAVRPAQHRLA